MGWTTLLETVILGDSNSNYQKITKLLLKHGADRNIVDKNGIYPLEHAIKNNLTEIVRIIREDNQ